MTDVDPSSSIADMLPDAAQLFSRVTSGTTTKREKHEERDMEAKGEEDGGILTEETLRWKHEEDTMKKGQGTRPKVCFASSLKRVSKPSCVNLYYFAGLRGWFYPAGTLARSSHGTGQQLRLVHDSHDVGLLRLLDHGLLFETLRAGATAVAGPTREGGVTGTHQRVTPAGE